MTGSGGLVEVQGTAEGRTFARRDLNRMLDAAWDAIQHINQLQARAIASVSSAKTIAGGVAGRRAARK